MMRMEGRTQQVGESCANTSPTARARLRESGSVAGKFFVVSR